MRKTIGAVTGLALLSLLLVGPAYLAVSNASPVERCVSDLSCEARPQLDVR